MLACSTYLLDIFWEIDKGRHNSFGFEPLSALEIEAWSRLSGNRLSPTEFAIIRLMDDAYLSAQAERSKADAAPAETNKNGPRVAERKLSPALFDSLWP